MDSNTSDIIRVRFIGMLSLERVVVENSDLRGQDFSQNVDVKIVSTCMSSEPVTTQFFLGTKTAALTGRSQTWK